MALQVRFSLGLSSELGSLEQSGTQKLAQADASQGFSAQGTVSFPSASVPMPLSFKLSPDRLTNNHLSSLCRVTALSDSNV